MSQKKNNEIYSGITEDDVLCAIAPIKTTGKIRLIFWIPQEAYLDYQTFTDSGQKISQAFMDYIQNTLSKDLYQYLLDIKCEALGGDPMERKPSEGHEPASVEASPTAFFHLHELKEKFQG